MEAELYLLDSGNKKKKLVFAEEDELKSALPVLMEKALDSETENPRGKRKLEEEEEEEQDENEEKIESEAIQVALRAEAQAGKVSVYGGGSSALLANLRVL